MGEIDEHIKQLVEDLLETVDADGRAGLAANQIGVGLRAFSWNIDGDVDYILNPRLVEVSKDEYQDGDEGCLSVPGLFFPASVPGMRVLKGLTWMASRKWWKAKSLWDVAFSMNVTT